MKKRQEDQEKLENVQKEMNDVAGQIKRAKIEAKDAERQLKELRHMEQVQFQFRTIDDRHQMP